jgi:hypothetical protein
MVPGKGSNAAQFTVIAPLDDKFSGRKVVVARIIAGGTDWGEFCEMMVEGQPNNK